MAFTHKRRPPAAAGEVEQLRAALREEKEKHAQTIAGVASFCEIDDADLIADNSRLRTEIDTLRRKLAAVAVPHPHTVRRADPASDAALDADTQLAFAVEFRIPVPRERPGGYAEVAVLRDELDASRWAVTDGAHTGLCTWVPVQGWRRMADVGRTYAYRYSREEALQVARWVAILIGARADEAERLGGDSPIP